MSQEVPTITIPVSYYSLLSETAASRVGMIAARSWRRISHPGDSLGTLLCEAQRLDDVRMVVTMGFFMAGFWNECDRLETERPTLTEVLDVLHLAVNTGRYPEADVEKMRRTLARRVPNILSSEL